jgi:DNA repair protein RadD
MTELRSYQTEITAEFRRRVAGGARSILLVAPTGSGKTIIAGSIVQSAVAEGQRVLVLAHRREIIAQTVGKLLANGIDPGIIQAGFADDRAAAVQIASVQTLHARAIRSSRLALPAANLLVVDECHHATARTWRAIIEGYPAAVLLGLTATPCRGDGRGLGGIFKEMIECPQVQDLIDGEFLVPTWVYAPAIPDLAGVHVKGGDYIQSALATRMDRPKLVGDIVSHWHRLADDRRTVVFASSVQHSVHLRDDFRKSGVSADHLDGSTPKDERDDILAKLRCGAIDVVCNYGVLTEGWDLPDIGCIVLARPTRKLGLYRQMIGRGLRPAPGKLHAIIIDHSGAVHTHGFVEDPVEWTLDPDRQAKNATHAARGVHGVHSRLVDCSKCGALRVGGEACRHCGFKPAPPPKYLPFIDGDLGLVARNGEVWNHRSSAEQLEWLRMLTAIALERGYKSGWIAHKFKEKFDTWPARGNVEPQPPSREVLSWVRSRQIAYAKGREKGRNAERTAAAAS